MKFLVLALCVCAASAASFGAYGNSAYRPNRFNPVSAPVAAPVAVAKAVVTAPVVAAAAVPAVASYPVAVAAKTYQNEADAVIVRDESDVRPDGYAYAYETNNGIVGESTGTLKRVGDADALVVQGTYRYVAPDGTPVVFNYVADENGFQPQSDLLPVAPAIPEAIARSLAYIASRTQQEAAKKF